MIEQVTIVNSYNEAITIGLRRPEESGYAITSIGGLEPTQVDIKTTQLTSGTRYLYTAGFHKQRDITLQILYYPQNDLLLGVEELREKLYKYCKTNDKVKLYFEKNHIRYAIEGYVKEHKSTIFSNACGANISITCPDPWLYKTDIEHHKTISLSQPPVGSTDSFVYMASIVYDGTFRSGPKFSIKPGNYSKFVGDMTVKIDNNEGSHSIKFLIPSDGLRYPLSSGYSDGVLVVSVIKEQLSVLLYDASDLSSPPINKIGWADISTMNLRQNFPILRNGLNDISVTLTGEDKDTAGEITMAYATLYMGV